MGYTYRRRRSGPNWGLIVSLVLVAGAAAYFVPQYLNPQAGPPPPPLGSDAAPASAAAPSPAPTSPAIRLPEADQQLAAGHWSAAAAIYADVAHAAPSVAAAHAGWARALISVNKPADAVEHAQKAVDLEPKSAEFQALLALAFDWSGNTDRALTSARRATELDPKLARGWAYLAEAEADKFRLREAGDALDRAAAAGGGDDPEVIRVQAYVAETNADYPAAVSLYKRAVDRAPERSYLGWGQLGWVFYVQKIYDKAQPNFEKAVVLEKDAAKNAEYRHALGWIYLNTKQWDKAKQEFTKALEENPDLQGAKDGLQVLASTPAR
ncbi:MAG: tetratricopeptide repeat protein [Chloroflexi bacterium]|nr:tetratricopeptide repeat protein [Chloroflexota bacterium]